MSNTLKQKRQECIVYSRVVGWITPLHNWNKGKKSEFDDRVPFSVIKSMAHNSAVE